MKSLPEQSDAFGHGGNQCWYDWLWQWARVGRRFSVLDSVYGAVLALALWMTIDLDHPGMGLIRVGNLPVVETSAVMRCKPANIQFGWLA